MYVPSGSQCYGVRPRELGFIRHLPRGVIMGGYALTAHVIAVRLSFSSRLGALGVWEVGGRWVCFLPQLYPFVEFHSSQVVT